MTIRERYFNDPQFNRLVYSLYTEICRGNFTPTEIREAAMLAQIKYEEENPRPVIFDKEFLMKVEEKK